MVVNVGWGSVNHNNWGGHLLLKRWLSGVKQSLVVIVITDL